MSENIGNILKQLDTLSIENCVSVYIPSLKQTVKFKALNLKQQKDLLKSTIDETLVKIAFNNLLTSIIKENIIDSINVDKLFTYDRSAIAVGLRTNSLDKNIILQDKTIDLTSKVAEYPALPGDFKLPEPAIEDNNVVVNLQIPQLYIDREINVFAINKFKQTQDIDVRAMISDLVIYEFIKFVKGVSIKAETGEQHIVFDAIKPSERISIVEKFPTTITNKIFELVKQYRSFETQFLQIDDITLDIDGNFFTV